MTSKNESDAPKTPTIEHSLNPYIPAAKTLSSKGAGEHNLRDAQVQATLAVAFELGRINATLERLLPQPASAGGE